MAARNLVLLPAMLYLKGCELNQACLKILKMGDPRLLNFESCKLVSDLTFKNILEAFPFADSIHFKMMELPKTWLVDLFETKRKVDLTSFESDITLTEINDINVNQLRQLFCVSVLIDPPHPEIQ